MHLGKGENRSEWFIVGSQEGAIGFIRHKDDARLIAAAPEMHELLYEVMQELKGYETKVSYKKTYYELIQELLDRIDGKEVSNA